MPPCLVCPESGSKVRVLAFAANHFAIADGGAAGIAVGGSGEYGFVYMNLRIGKGRTNATKTIAGCAISAAAKAHFDYLLQTAHIGVTVQVDEGQEAFDEKHSSIHPLFKKA